MILRNYVNSRNKRMVMVDYSLVLFFHQNNAEQKKENQQLALKLKEDDVLHKSFRDDVQVCNSNLSEVLEPNVIIIQPPVRTKIKTEDELKESHEGFSLES